MTRGCFTHKYIHIAGTRCYLFMGSRSRSHVSNYSCDSVSLYNWWLENLTHPTTTMLYPLFRCYETIHILVFLQQEILIVTNLTVTKAKLSYIGESYIQKLLSLLAPKLNAFLSYKIYSFLPSSHSTEYCSQWDSAL